MCDHRLDCMWFISSVCGLFLHVVVNVLLTLQLAAVIVCLSGFEASCRNIASWSTDECSHVGDWCVLQRLNFFDLSSRSMNIDRYTGSCAVVHTACYYIICMQTDFNAECKLVMCEVYFLTAAASPLPFRLGEPVLCGSQPLVTPIFLE